MKTKTHANAYVAAIHAGLAESRRERAKQGRRDAMNTKKRRMPTKKQWAEIHRILGNGWGDGDMLEYADTPAEKDQMAQSVRAFEEWLADRGLDFKVKIVASKQGRTP